MAAAEAGVATAKGALASAQAQVKGQQVNRDQTEIRAPFDGVVLVKNANVGDMITPFSSAAGSQGAVVTVADMSTLEVEADVAESNVGKVRIDQPVEITLDALPDVRLAGSVVRIVPTVDRGLREADFWSIEIAGERPSIMSTSGLSICPRNCRAYAERLSTYRRWPSA